MNIDTLFKMAKTHSEVRFVDSMNNLHCKMLTQPERDYLLVDAATTLHKDRKITGMFSKNPVSRKFYKAANLYLQKYKFNINSLDIIDNTKIVCCLAVYTTIVILIGMFCK